MSLLNELLLNEANVFNASIPYKNVSIKQFVQKHIGNNITDPEVVKVLTKKLSTFLINDERFLQPIQQLPDDAPDWAHQAAQTGQLMVFVPSQQLNDVVSNIVHYVQAAEQNLDTADNNVVVQAQRELASIVKQPNLDELANRADQYFKATSSKQAVKDVEGMTGVVDYDGWIWYKLDTPESFTREGNTLQNCIGKHWTHEKTNKEGFQIYILRTPANDSVVAVRAKDKDVYEIKGKNNKPPIEKYMQPVFKFIRDYQFDISKAEHELIRAGYYVFNNNLIVPIAQAATMFFDKEQNKLVRIQPDNVIDVDGVETEVYTNQQAIPHINKIAIIAKTGHYYENPRHPRPQVDAIYKAMDGLFPVIHGTITYSGQTPIPDEYVTFIKNLASHEKLAIQADLCVPLGLSSVPPFKSITEFVEPIGAVAGLTGFDVSAAANQDKWNIATSYSFGDYKMTSYVNLKYDDFHKKTGTSINDIAVVYRRIRKQWGNEYTADLVITVNAQHQINGIFSNGYGIKHTQIRDIVNTLIAEHNLTIANKKAIAVQKLMMASPTQVVTKEDFISGKIQGASTDISIQFEDGSEFKHLTGDQLKHFVENSRSLTTGAQNVYQLVKNGEIKLIVPVNKKGILRWYATSSTRAVQPGDIPIDKSASIQYGPYIKALAKHLNVPIRSKENDLSEQSGMYKILSYLARIGREVDYNSVIPNSGARGDFGYITERTRKYNPLKELEKLGLIQLRPAYTNTGKKVTAIALSSKGRDVIVKVRQGDINSLFDIIPTRSIEQSSGTATREPTPKPPREPIPREPKAEGQPRANNAVGRTGTKATEAYNKYVEMTRANNGTQPTRAQFIAILREPPFNMTPAGASTYQYNIKTKYQQQQGNLGESFTFKEWLMAIL